MAPIPPHTDLAREDALLALPLMALRVARDPDDVHYVDLDELPDDVLAEVEREQRRRRGARKPERWSMSTLRRSEECMLSVVFDREAGTAGPPAIQGTALHEVVAAVTFGALMRGEPGVEPEAAAAAAGSVLARFQEPLTHEQRRLILGWVWEWAQTFVAPVGADEWVVEDLWTRPLGFHTMSAKLDLASRAGDLAEIVDYKTGHPPRDPRYITDAPQPRNYSWHAMEHWPDVEAVLVTEHWTRNGMRASVMYERDEVYDDIQPWLHQRADALATAYAKGQFKPTPGSHCANCALPQRCPLPDEVKVHGIRTNDDLEAAAQALAVLEARAKRLRDGAKAYMDVMGVAPVTVGDQALGFHPITKRQVIGIREARAQGIENDLAEAKALLDTYKIDRTTTEFTWRKQ